MPLYRSKAGKIEAKENDPAANRVIEMITQAQVLATTEVETFLVPKSSIAALRSRGVVMSPIALETEGYLIYIIHTNDMSAATLQPQ